MTETELYRLFDVTTSWYKLVSLSSQTEGVPSGMLVFVRQGKHGRSTARFPKHGALSLMIVGGRVAGGPPEDEFTILIRGCRAE